ncbi:MAG: hypothetical protein KME42_28310 [Tildeniella nuda ZEHNDER 1965/U140]|jgi:DNA polymerase I-like protein with 3'-5' exonuclease and polymerase domains|nr:hypothetical protein [Tildeniella nuda ZEHNDER 1965/U140]
MLTHQHSLLFADVPLNSGIIYSRTASTRQIAKFIDVWSDATAVAVDIETYGEGEMDGLDPWKGLIRTIQVGLRDGSCLIADLGGWEDDRATLISRLESLGFFAQLKASVESKDQWTVGHNLNFDLQWLIKLYGFKPWKCADTMLLSQIYWAGIEQYRHSLKAVCERLGFEIDQSQQRSDWGWALTNEQLNYAAYDTTVLFKVWQKLGLMCTEQGLSNTCLAEFGALPAFAEMSVYGFPADRTALENITQQYQSAADEIAKPFNATFPGLSVDDNAKLPPAIREKLSINVDKTDKEALNPHRSHPVISSLLATRSIGAYLDYLANCKLAYRDGAIRGGYRQCAPQGRGRSTSGKSNGVPSVNLQNPPNPSKACPEVAVLHLPPVRSLFRPPAGYKLLVVDYSAAHARIAAETTGDKLFQASYIDDVDVHAIVAAKLSTLADRNWTREQISAIRKQKDAEGKLATTLRNIAKNVFYGWLNGAGAKKTAATVEIGGFRCTVEFAQSIIDLLQASFSGVKQYHDRVKRSIRTDKVWFEGCKLPYTWAVGLSGRRVFLPIWEAKEGGYGGAKPTDAVMVAWMTVEADSIKTAMHQIRLAAEVNPEWGLRLCNINHDELNCLCKEEHAEAAGYAVWLAMQSALAYFVRSIPAYENPYSAESVVCSDWSEK